MQAPLEIKWVRVVLVWPKTSSGISLQDIIVEVCFEDNAYSTLVYVTSAIAIFFTTFNALSAYRYLLLIFFLVSTYRHEATQYVSFAQSIQINSREKYPLF